MTKVSPYEGGALAALSLALRAGKGVNISGGTGGGGDMLKATYDPGNIEGDAFDYNNLINTPTLFSGDYGDLSNTPDLSIYAEISNLGSAAFSNDYNDLDNKPTIIAPHTILGLVEYTSAGTFNYTPTTGTKRIIVLACGAGGGSGGVGNSAGTGGSGSGSAGETRLGVFDISSVTPPISITVGSPGSAGGSGNFAGGNGGDTSVGGLLSCGGGKGGGGSTGANFGSNGGPPTAGSGGITLPTLMIITGSGNPNNTLGRFGGSSALCLSIWRPFTPSNGASGGTSIGIGGTPAYDTGTTSRSGGSGGVGYVRITEYGEF